MATRCGHRDAAGARHKLIGGQTRRPGCLELPQRQPQPLGARGHVLEGARRVAHATQRMNPLGEREISLRGYKIAAIENTGTLKDG